MRTILRALTLAIAFAQFSGGSLAADGAATSSSAVSASSTSPAGIANMGKYLTDAMGVDGVETLAQPSRGQGAGAKTTAKGSIDLACAMPSGQVRSSRGVQIRFQSCDGTAGNISMTVAVCVAGMFRAETCGDTSFQTMVLRDGTYTTGPENVRFGLGCNSSKVCTISFSASLTIQGTGDELTRQADAQHAAALANPNSLISGVGQVYNSNAYADQQRTQTVVDMSSVLSGAQQTGAGCTTTGVCLRKVSSERRFTRTCDRSFLLTERTERFTLQPASTATCTQIRGGPNGVYTNPETILDDSCIQREQTQVGDAGNWVFTGVVTNQRQGMTEVGRKLVQSCPGWIGGDAEASQCAGDTYEAYYVDLSKFDKGAVGYNPLALSRSNPTCDERAEAKTVTCMSDTDWFGRTLTATQCMAKQYDPEGVLHNIPMDYTQQAGCGVCTDKTSTTTCYGEPTNQQPQDSCSGVDLQGCSSPSVTALTYSGDNAGLVTSQREAYSCVRRTEVCEEYESVNSSGARCSISDPNVSAKTFGIENVKKQRPDSDGFAQAAADVAMAEEIGASFHDAASNTTQLMPQIFGGKDLRCGFPTSGLLGAGSLLSKQCCRTDLERPKKGFLIQNGCDDNEVQLAAARRQNYTHFVGERCTSRSPWPLRKCLVKEQTHCAYNGLFPRLVAEQGRIQLSTIAASGSVGNTQQGRLAFDFYSTSDAGSWTAPLNVNGVKVAAYQWPKFCANPAEIAHRQTTDPNAPDCPGVLSVWLAGCDAADCGELPKSPELGGMGWAVTGVDPLSVLTTPTSKYSVARGACDTATSKCAYDVSAWPAGQGGKLVFTKDVSFLIWDSAPQVEGGGGGIGVATKPTVMGQQQNVSDVFYRPYSYVGAPSTTLPATMRIDFSTDGGTKTWTSVNVPTQITGEFTVPGTDLKLSGGCDVLLNACRYRLVGTTIVETKGWGGPGAPDCSGFTAGQIAAMDFSKMDLSEWLNEVVSRSGAAGETIATRLAASTKAQTSNATASSGGQIAAPSKTTPYAMATPGEGYGPFETTIAAAGYWPYAPAAGAQNSERVVSVTVNWGDCSAEQALPLVTSIGGQAAHGFRGKHTYQAPNAAQHESCGMAREGNIEHRVVLTVRTDKGGSYNTGLTVRNVWTTYQGARGNVATPTVGP